MRNATPLLLAMLAACSNGNVAVQAQTADPAANVRRQIVAHAPYKQWDLQTGAPNKAIGRAPGGACETISYLVAGVRPDTAALAKAATLADWVLDRQNASSALPISGGVASTPDLAPPSNAYHYSIDAVFCARAMLDMEEATDDRKYDQSAERFGAFLLAMMRDGSGRPIAPGGAGRAPCEAVVQQERSTSAWNCQHHVKMLVALPTLARLEKAFPGRGYAQAAADTRATLMPGLEGLWEYAEPKGARLHWRRIDGPRGERDTFVYGDTLAYALKGLYGSEGASADVQRLYARFAGMAGRDPRTTAYDGHLAFAGYIRVDARGNGTPDPDSAYYDIVTMGLLDAVRRDVAPDDARRAYEVMRDSVGPRQAIGWHMRFDLTAKSTGNGDVSTLAAIGTVLDAAQRTATATMAPKQAGMILLEGPVTERPASGTNRAPIVQTAPSGGTAPKTGTGRTQSRALPPAN